MSTPTKTTLLQSLAQVPRSAAVDRFVNSLYSIFQTVTGAQQQVATSNFQTLQASTILIGTKGRIRSLPNGITIESLGVDGVWHPVITSVQP